MAKVKWIDERLANWARWKLSEGSGSMSHVNLLTADMPRAPYAEAPIPITDCEASDTDEAVMRLPGDLQMTVIEYYLGTGGLRDKLRRLVCSEATLYARIYRAHRLLADHFTAKKDKAQAERDRVEKLTSSRQLQGFYGR